MLTRLHEQVSSFLDRMELPSGRSDDGLYMFRFGSTAVVVSLFRDDEQAETFVRFSATTLIDFEPSNELVAEILRLNSEVYFGSFLLFPDNTLCFSATLLGNNLDFEEFETALNYVARVSDDYDDVLQALAGGQRVSDVMKEYSD